MREERDEKGERRKAHFGYILMEILLFAALAHTHSIPLFAS